VSIIGIINLSLLGSKTGETYLSFVLNWWQRKNREPNQIYILVPVSIVRTSFSPSSDELFEHVGPKGLTPDVLLLSDDEGYSAILDNKAYSKYSITNDHHNRMVYNYIGQLNNYYNGTYPLSFFSYIAGGFGSNINIQLNRVVNETGINGSAINISTMINLVYEHTSNPYTQQRIRDIFSLNRRVLQADLWVSLLFYLLFL